MTDYLRIILELAIILFGIGGAWTTVKINIRASNRAIEKMGKDINELASDMRKRFHGHNDRLNTMNLAVSLELREHEVRIKQLEGNGNGEK